MVFEINSNSFLEIENLDIKSLFFDIEAINSPGLIIFDFLHMKN